ncbi:MAG: HIT domain-containing protein [Fervidicoccaceae archaeon]
MDRLWAPWRSEYLKRINSESLRARCFICEAAQAPLSKDHENLVVYRGKRSLLMLNLYPYNAGHIMVAPYRHVASLVDLENEEALDLFTTIRLGLLALGEAFSPDAFNVGINIGRDSGAGLEDHVHVHIVPRWRGDTNFMPVLFDTKVISESLEKVYEKLSAALKIILERERRA